MADLHAAWPFVSSGASRMTAESGVGRQVPCDGARGSRRLP
jgi:hypothetical protein